MLKKLYNIVIEYFGKRSSPAMLAITAFSEASFFPIPPEVFLIPMCIARPTRALLYSLMTTLFSVLGAFGGYIIGALLMDSVGVRIINLFNLAGEMEKFKHLYLNSGGWVVFIAAFTPIPYKVFTIASGAMNLNVYVFTLASALGRGLRYLLIGIPFMLWGEDARNFIEENLNKVTLLATLFIVIVMVAWKSFF